MYRISIFGEPGSGKSTIARALKKELSCKLVEVSEEIIAPIASLSGRYPKIGTPFLKSFDNTRVAV